MVTVILVTVLMSMIISYFVTKYITIKYFKIIDGYIKELLEDTKKLIRDTTSNK